jgi:hypothetical protein
MNLNTMIGLFNIGSALLIILLSIPLINRKVKMNNFYGIRIRKSFESEENWYTINAYGGKQLAIWSIPVILAGFGCFLLPIHDPDKILLPLLLVIGPITICIAVALVKILAYAKKL